MDENKEEKISNNDSNEIKDIILENYLADKFDEICDIISLATMEKAMKINGTEFIYESEDRMIIISLFIGKDLDDIQKDLIKNDNKIG